MRYLLFLLTLSISLAMCKSEPASVKAQYPTFWQKNNIPEFEEGLITKTSTNEEGIKVSQTVYVETSSSFEEIHSWFLNEFKSNGWKNVKNLRKNIGQDDELVILVHTLGKLKHSITVLKVENDRQQIKTVVSKFSN